MVWVLRDKYLPLMGGFSRRVEKRATRWELLRELAWPRLSHCHWLENKFQAIEGFLGISIRKCLALLVSAAVPVTGDQTVLPLRFWARAG